MKKILFSLIFIGFCFAGQAQSVPPGQVTLEDVGGRVKVSYSLDGAYYYLHPDDYVLQCYEPQYIQIEAVAGEQTSFPHKLRRFNIANFDFAGSGIAPTTDLCALADLLTETFFFRRVGGATAPPVTADTIRLDAVTGMPDCFQMVHSDTGIPFDTVCINAPDSLEAMGLVYIDPTTGELKTDSTNYRYDPVANKITFTGIFDPIAIGMTATDTATLNGMVTDLLGYIAMHTDSVLYFHDGEFWKPMGSGSETAETTTTIAIPQVDVTDPFNPRITIDYTNEDGSQTPVDAIIPIPSEVNSGFDLAPALTNVTSIDMSVLIAAKNLAKGGEIHGQSRSLAISVDNGGAVYTTVIDGSVTNNVTAATVLPLNTPYIIARNTNSTGTPILIVNNPSSGGSEQRFLNVPGLTATLTNNGTDHTYSRGTTAGDQLITIDNSTYQGGHTLVASKSTVTNGTVTYELSDGKVFWEKDVSSSTITLGKGEAATLYRMSGGDWHIVSRNTGISEITRKMQEWSLNNGSELARDTFVYGQFASILEDDNSNGAYYSFTAAEVFEGNPTNADRVFMVEYARNLAGITSTAVERFFGANNADLIIDPVLGIATAEANVEILDTIVTDASIKVVYKCRNANWTSLRRHQIWGNSGALANVNALTGKQILLDYDIDYQYEPNANSGGGGVNQISSRVGEFFFSKSGSTVQGYLPLTPGTVTNGAIDYPVWAAMYPEFVAGNDIVFPADVEGMFLRNLGGNAGNEGAFQDHALQSHSHTLRPLVGSFGGQSGGFSNGGLASTGGFTGGVSPSANIAVETRSVNRAYQLYTIVDNYNEVMLAGMVTQTTPSLLYATSEDQQDPNTGDFINWTANEVITGSASVSGTDITLPQSSDKYLVSAHCGFDFDGTPDQNIEMAFTGTPSLSIIAEVDVFDIFYKNQSDANDEASIIQFIREKAFAIYDASTGPLTIQLEVTDGAVDLDVSECLLEVRQQ